MVLSLFTLDLNALKMGSVIPANACWCSNSTANEIAALPSVLLKQRVDWLELFMAQSDTLVFVHRPGSRKQTNSAHTEPEDRREQFAEFEVKLSRWKCRTLRKRLWHKTTFDWGVQVQSGRNWSVCGARRRKCVGGQPQNTNIVIRWKLNIPCYRNRFIRMAHCHWSWQEWDKCNVCLPNTWPSHWN